RPGMASPAPAAARGGMFGGGFGGALMGGLIGVGIGGLLFGNGLFGGISGLGGLLGLLIQIALVVLLVRFALRFFRSRQPAMAGGPREGMGMAREAQPAPRPMMGGGGGAATQPIQVTQADYQAFEALLRDINAAWSRRDEAGLARLATPEMASYFAQDLRDLDARGWRNETSDVRLEQGDLSEAWREADGDYATVAMRFSLVDVTYDTQGRVVEGDPATRSTATELWTFRRRRGGPWQLSAIQQAG
ncbi:Tim44 domain-containing protein, partial [Teichococcus cervicalis]